MLVIAAFFIGLVIGANAISIYWGIRLRDSRREIDWLLQHVLDQGRDER